MSPSGTVFKPTSLTWLFPDWFASFEDDTQRKDNTYQRRATWEREKPAATPFTAVLLIAVCMIELSRLMFL